MPRLEKKWIYPDIQPHHETDWHLCYISRIETDIFDPVAAQRHGRSSLAGHARAHQLGDGLPLCTDDRRGLVAGPQAAWAD